MYIYTHTYLSETCFISSLICCTALMSSAYSFGCGQNML